MPVRIMKKIICMLGGLAMAVCLAAPAFALNLPDLEQEGSITLTVRDMETEDKAFIPGGTLTLYRVGTAAVDDGNYFYEIDKTYEPVESVIETYDANEAKKVSDFIDRHTDAIAGITVAVDENGKAVFDKLTAGLFLVRQEEAAPGYLPIDPFFITMPGKDDEDNWIYDVTGLPKASPETKKYNPVTVNPPVQKKLTGDKPEKDEEFTFTLMAVATTAKGLEDNLPMPEGSEGQTKTIAIVGAGQGAFGEIIFDRPGTYVYSVKEQAKDTEGYTFDLSLYEITYEVTADGESLSVTESITKDGKPVEGVVFENTYETEEESSEETTPETTEPPTTEPPTTTAPPETTVPPSSPTVILGETSHTWIYALLSCLAGLLFLSGAAALYRAKRR